MSEESHKISELEKRVKDIEKKMDGVENLISTGNDHIEEIGRAVHEINKITSASAGNVPHDVEKKLGQLNEVARIGLDLSNRVDKLEKHASSLVGKGGKHSEHSPKEIETFSRNLSAMDSRIDAMEHVSKKLTEQIQKSNLDLHKIGNIDRLSSISKEISNKMDEFKFMESEIKRISNRVEGFYENLDKRLDKIREFDKQFPEVRQDMKGLREEVMRKLDENKVVLLDRSTKDETSALRSDIKRLEGEIAKLRGNMDNSSIVDMERQIKKLMDDIKKDMSKSNEPISVMNIELSDMMSRIIAIETRMGNLENITQKMGTASPIVIE